VIRRATVAKKSAKQVIRREAETEGHIAHKKAVAKKAAPAKKVAKKEADTQGHVVKRGAPAKKVTKREADVAGHVHIKGTARRSNDPEGRIR